MLLDWLGGLERPLAVGPWSLDRYELMFGLGAAARAVGVLLLLGAIEPGAWPWRRILARASEGRMNC